METYTHLYNTTKFWFPFWSELSRKQLMLASFFFCVNAFQIKVQKIKKAFFFNSLPCSLFAFVFVFKANASPPRSFPLTGGRRPLPGGRRPRWAAQSPVGRHRRWHAGSSMSPQRFGLSRRLQRWRDNVYHFPPQKSTRFGSSNHCHASCETSAK